MTYSGLFSLLPPTHISQLYLDYCISPTMSLLIFLFVAAFDHCCLPCGLPGIMLPYEPTLRIVASIGMGERNGSGGGKAIKIINLPKA